ncbi:hypothetical protein EDC04DRAFT_2556513 [Pisolithus marmoratus]|nr:hypothetical protein EDC04DRAFT_2556513 [Pisolithus marmoratus]
MAFLSCRTLAFLHLLAQCFSQSHAQSISTNTPVPPLQWLNITGLLQGSFPPPLKYPSIGYDDSSRNLIIFGGESSSGIPTAQTFLHWSTPSAQPDLPQSSPPARYMALSGDDFSSSYRNAHLVIGGRGASGQALSDAWEFDYISQFWSEVNVSPGGPQSRWSASGGRDYRVPADAASSNTTFYMAGGTDGTTLFSLTDVWEFQINGTLASNLANNTFGSWISQTIGSTPGYSTNQASTVLGSSIVSVSGCNTTTDTNENCANRNEYVISAGTTPGEIALPACPAPRYGATMVFNPLSIPSNFQTQVFLLLGTFNSSAWDDQGGLQKGEVAILDIGTGSWSRVLPAGDPGTTGVPAYPSPREGAVALSYSEALVGSNRQVGADTIVFGGEDDDGNYLNEVWILRAYNGTITSSNASWGGPSGDLQTGINADGAGVTVQYMTQCAVNLITPTSSAPSVPASSSASYPNSLTYDVSVVHKLFAPLSVALVLPAVLLTRLALPSTRSAERKPLLIYMSSFIGVMAYVLGVVGLVISFTSTRSNMSVAKRATSTSTLPTSHSIAGLALFVGLYVVVPVLYLLATCIPCILPKKSTSDIAPSRANSMDTAEKLTSVQQTQRPLASPTSHQARLHSWGGSSFCLGGRSTEGRASTDSGSMHSTVPQRGFEVLNRPARTRRVSSNGATLLNMESYQRVPTTPRSFGDTDWFARRRSPNATNSPDATPQGIRVHATSSGSTPNTADIPSGGVLLPPVSRPTCELPSFPELCLRMLFHALVLALCILSLVALWHRAPKSSFVVFLSWALLFYIMLIVLAWRGRPARSFLTTVVVRLRARPSHAAVPPSTPGSRPLSMAGTEQYLFPTDVRGPYLHHPPYRTAAPDDFSMTPMGPRSVETDDDDDDIDEVTRQRQIEEEMGRREVSIVTVPKRRLWVTNPS